MKTVRNSFYFVVCVLLVTLSFVHADTVLIEAESFDDSGGWLIDQQMMDQMGSPYLIAHGLGKPVADAKTTVKFPKTGDYRIWVRTRDWVAPWNAPGAPGKFEVIVNGKKLDKLFGTEGADWHWQKGPKVTIDKKEVTVVLHDLMGFDGRCDAIVFSTDDSFDPPNENPGMNEFRRKMLGLPEKPIDEGKFDLVVVGGGMGGICAAVSGARLGLDVALIQNRPVLGGNNSSEVRVHLNGRINLPPYPALGDVVAELDSGLQGNAHPAHHYNDDRKLGVVRAEKKLKLFLNMHAFDIEMKDNKIVAVIGKHIKDNTEHRFAGDTFADCTGDGTVGFLAGADWRMGREGKAETGEDLAPDKPDKMTMGSSVQWYSLQQEDPVEFPETPWAVKFNEKTCQPMFRGDWNWETGMNRDQICDFEFIRDYGLRVAFGNWSYLKNKYSKKNEYACSKLEWIAYVAGKRESRRLLGDVILQEQDVVEQKQFPDAFVTTTWTIDLHYPMPENSEEFPGEEFRSIAKHKRIKPYPIPYRCLYSRNIDNLFMAGRDISVTHVALGTIRVMRTGGMMGELVGMAASLCEKHDTNPRGVYTNHLDELKTLATKGVGKNTPPQPVQEWLKTMGPNLAMSAAVKVSGYYDEKQYPSSAITDGRANTSSNAGRWVSNEEGEKFVELTWNLPETFAGFRLVTGYTNGGPVDPISDCILQYHDDKDWKDIKGTKITRNRRTDVYRAFDPVKTDKIRLLITNTPGNRARIWELEIYKSR